LIGERVVLVTLGFDLNVHHPYKPLVEAIKKFKVAQNALAQVAWNFVNDGYVKITALVIQIVIHEHAYLQRLKRGVQAPHVALLAI
jgi:cyclin T